jgi:subtilisin-like proprotein convertase family protein
MSPAARIWVTAFCGAAFLLAPPKSFGGVFSFSNTNAVIINDSNTPPTIATPYPSTLSVTGFAGQVITDVTVTLRNLNHTFPSDVDMLLIGPTGQMCLLMAEVGGSEPFAVTNLTLSLNDSANPLPIEDPLFPGTYRPTARFTPLLFDFPAPVPPGSSNAVPSLSVFDGTDPTGTWQLFVVDDASGDDGVLSGGWTLTLNISVPLQVKQLPSKVVISWPASAPGLTLQTSPLLTNLTSWTNVPIVPSFDSGKWVVTNAVTSVSRFYRLVGP